MQTGDDRHAEAGIDVAATCTGFDSWASVLKSISYNTWKLHDSCRSIVSSCNFHDQTTGLQCSVCHIILKVS